MEANLAGSGGVAKSQRSFPYSNWGPWAAVLGVLAALGVGIFLAVPALLIGAQEGKIEARFPPGFTTSAGFDKGDATAIAVDPATNFLYADHEDEVRVFGARGGELPRARIGGLEDSHGLAVDPRLGLLLVSELGPGRITALAAGRAGAAPGAGAAPQLAPIDASRLPANLAGFAPERLAVAPGAAGGLYAIDTGDGAVLRFDAKGAYRGRLEPPGSPAPASFDFGSGDNDIAVDSHRGAGFGDVFVLSGKGDGTVWAFSPSGRFLWEMTPESGDEFAALTVDSAGDLWIAEPGGDVYEYAASAGARRAPERTGRKIAAGDEVSAIEFSGGHLFVARELDDTLDTLGNVISQIGTALGFLLVPMALAAMRGARGPREIFARLGVQAFRPSALKWMGLTVVLYLAFNVFYSAVITEPHQQDIAKGFGAIPVQIILIVIAAPVTEEVCFRGMLFGGLREKLPRLVAALLCGLIFGALHAITGISAVPPLIVFGFLLALLYERTGSILPGMLLHMLNNIVALASQ
ncbi:MAG TPA: CPBP family glutamic-type intramembrane protease [Solirubrobacterales bacterium]|nr:CPBP family glutamic-type intramembrane protease [Solirubrobacterales bacterium]